MTWEDILKRGATHTDGDGNKWPRLIVMDGKKYEYVDINEHSGFGIYQNDNERFSLPLLDAWDLAKLSRITQTDLRQPSVHISNDEFDYKEYNEETDGS